MSFLRDFKFGLRILRRNPAYACSAVTVMALGIGSVTAVFSVLHGVLLTPLPYREPDRIVLFRADLPGYANQPALTAEEYWALAARTDLFESVAAAVESDGNLTAPDNMAALNAVVISDNFLETLGVTLALGRSVARRGGQVREVNISYEVWQRHFGRDPAIIGRRIDVNNTQRTVVGVLPQGFTLHLGPGAGVPSRVDLCYPRSSGYDADPFRGQVVIARLRRDVTVESARAAVITLATNLVADRPASYRTGPMRLSLSALDREVASDVKPALMAAAGAVAFVLLTACANLTNLLLARATARTRELAVRMAIGASRLQVARQVAIEGLLVGGLGAAGGLLLATSGVAVLLRFAPGGLPRREAIDVDMTVAGFAIAVAFISALLASLAPSWHAAKLDVAGRIKNDGVSPRSARLTRGLLVAGQLAFALILLTGAGLMARAFVNLRAVPLGFEPHHAATMYVSLQAQPFGTGTLDEARARRLAFYHQLTDAVRGISGVQQFGVGFPAPMTGMSMVQRFSLGDGTSERTADAIISLAGFQETLGVPLLAGRYFDRSDDDQPVVIVDEHLASSLWPQRPAPGQRLLLATSSGPRWTTVVGVVKHVQMQGVRGEGPHQLWLTYATRSYAELNVVLRAEHPMALVPVVDKTAQQLGSGRPIRDARLLDDAVADASSDTRFALFVFGMFGLFSVLLAAIGLYGVVSYAVARRTREIAVRVALGADRRRIFALVTKEGLGWIAAGVCSGAAGALLITRYLSTLLFRVPPTDALTFGAVSGVLCAVALAAAALPAFRAVRADPMLGLRAE